MPESSLQDLRDDWKVGDDVLVEFQGHSGTTSSVRSGRIVGKESAFATVRIENGTTQKIPYKRLRKVVKPARPVPAQPQQSPQQMSLLRSVPPALAKLGATLTPEPEATPAPAAITATPPPKKEEQQLVKIPARSAKQAAPTPTVTAPPITPAPSVARPIVAPPIAAPAVAKELPEEESETYDAKTWLADSTKVLSQLNLKSKRLQAEYEEAVALAAEMRAAVESVEAEIDTVRKMREFIAKYRPKVQLHRVRLQ